MGDPSSGHLISLGFILTCRGRGALKGEGIQTQNEDHFGNSQGFHSTAERCNKGGQISNMRFLREEADALCSKGAGLTIGAFLQMRLSPMYCDVKLASSCCKPVHVQDCDGHLEATRDGSFRLSWRYWLDEPALHCDTGGAAAQANLHQEGEKRGARPSRCPACCSRSRGQWSTSRRWCCQMCISVCYIYMCIKLGLRVVYVKCWPFVRMPW